MSEMVSRQRDMRIPSELVPHCPVCGAPMTMNLRSDDRFVQDAGWDRAKERYDAFVRRHRKARVLYLELGVGLNTPGIIKLPFWQMTMQNPHAQYACINLGEAFCPQEMADKSLCINCDLNQALRRLAG